MAIGTAVIVIDEVAVTAPHPPEAAIVLVTVYMLGVLAAKFTNPVPPAITIPAVELNIPAVPPPLNAGDGFVPL